MNVHRCLIVPAAHAPLARSLSSSIAGPSGEGMWTTGLSPTGTGEPTHYISTGLIQQEFADLMTNTGAVFMAAQAAGVQTTFEDVQALLAESDITTEQPFDAMARLGLLIVQGEA